MKRGFTFIEIMVVVSIISMLSSVVVASVTPARAKARDATRRQQVRQVDLAIQLYKAKNGHAPYLEGCRVQQEVVTDGQLSGCVAISTQGVSSETPWKKLQDDLSEFIPSLPTDPCPGCVSPSGYDLAYYYNSPLAMQYYCQSSGCSYDNDSYQFAAPLETDDDSTSSNNQQNQNQQTYYPPPPEDHISPGVPTNFTTTLEGTPGRQTVTASWTAATDTGGSGLAGYTLNWRYLSGAVGSVDTIDTSIVRDMTSDFWAGSICFWVEAYDGAGNRSDGTSESCENIAAPGVNDYVSAPTNLQSTVTSVGGGRYDVHLTWDPSDSITSPNATIVGYDVYKNSVLQTTVVPNSYNVLNTSSWVPPFCWTVRAWDSAHVVSLMSAQDCPPDPGENTATPTITSVPAQVDETFPVVIHGTNFGDYVNGAPLTITFTAVNPPYVAYQFTSFLNDMNAGPTTVTLYISGMSSGPYNITATTPGGTSNAMTTTLVK